MCVAVVNVRGDPLTLQNDSTWSGAPSSPPLEAYGVHVFRLASVCPGFCLIVYNYVRFPKINPKSQNPPQTQAQHRHQPPSPVIVLRFFIIHPWKVRGWCGVWRILCWLGLF